MSWPLLILAIILPPTHPWIWGFLKILCTLYRTKYFTYTFEIYIVYVGSMELILAPADLGYQRTTNAPTSWAF